MKKWRQRLKYMTAAAVGVATLPIGCIPVSAATLVMPSTMIGAVKIVNIAIPVIAIVLCIIAFFFG